MTSVELRASRTHGSIHLAVVRIAVGLYALGYLLPRRRMLSRIFRTDPDLFDPVGLARLLDGPLPPAAMDGLYVLVVGSGLAFTLGYRFRWSGPAFALGLLALLSYRNSWSMILHMHNGLVVHVLVLGLARSADALSVDARLGAPDVDAEYRAPLRLIAAVTTIPYFLSGLAKVLGPEGWAWASGASLQAQVAVNALRYAALTDEGPAGLYLALADQTALFLLLGVGTLALELGAPLALFRPRWGVVWALATWSLHWGIYFMMGIKFRYHMTGVAFLALLFSPERTRPSSGGSDGTRAVAPVDHGDATPSSPTRASPTQPSGRSSAPDRVERRPRSLEITGGAGATERSAWRPVGSPEPPDVRRGPDRRGPC